MIMIMIVIMIMMVVMIVIMIVIVVALRQCCLAPTFAFLKSIYLLIYANPIEQQLTILGHRSHRPAAQ